MRLLPPLGRLRIESRKLDGTFRFETEVGLLYRSQHVLLGRGEPGRRVRRHDGERVREDWSLEYLPLDQPYNIVSFFEPDGRTRDHFCNVLSGARVARLGEYDLSYVDLDLDLLVRSDGSHLTLDRDQFEANARAMRYPPPLIAVAEHALRTLQALAEGGGHVFGCATLPEAEARLLELYARP